MHITAKMTLLLTAVEYSNMSIILKHVFGKSHSLKGRREECQEFIMGYEPSVHEIYLSINILDVMRIASLTFSFVLHILTLEHKVPDVSIIRPLQEVAPFEFRSRYEIVRYSVKIQSNDYHIPRPIVGNVTSFI